MIRKRTVKKVSVKKLRDQTTYIVVESVVPAKDTLFPEELKQAIEFLKQNKDCEFLKSHR